MIGIVRARGGEGKPYLVTDAIRQKPFRPGGFPRNCLHCKTAYNYHPAAKDKGHEHKRGLFCSWACKSAHIKADKPGRSSRLYTGYCPTCQSPIASRRMKKYCSLRCRPEVQPMPAADRVCKLCGTQYVAVNTGGKHKQFCSDQCQSIVKGARRREEKSARKAKLKGATIEKVDPFAVFARDKFHCRICGVFTPPEKRGTYANNAPELDHITPLSKGGAHSYANTQCTCRRCNIRKSDKFLTIFF